MESDIQKQSELISTEQIQHQRNCYCLSTPDYKQKYLALVRQKYGWNFIDKIRYNEQDAYDYEQQYDLWRIHYDKAIELNQQNPLLSSIKQTFNRQLWIAYFVNYIGLQFHIITPFLLYFVFQHILSQEYHSNYNKFLIACIIVTRVIRYFSSQYAENKLHQIGMNMYKLFANAIVRKALQCSILSNKKISVSQLSKLMHIDCEKLLTYPTKQALAIEGVFALFFLSGVIIFLAGFAGLIGIACLFLSMLLRYLLKKSQKKRQQQLTAETTKRVKTSIQIFSMMKFIKANALQSCYFNKLRQIRIVEVEKLKAKLFLDITQTVVIVIAKMLILFIIMKIVSILGGKFDVAIIFCLNLSLGSINLQTTVKTLSDVEDIKSSINKLQEFLKAQQMDSSYIMEGGADRDTAIKIKNGNFRWGLEQKRQQQTINAPAQHHLEDINVQIKKKQLVAIIGTYGSGKSSFANCLLGQMKSSANSQIIINGTLAYCCQSPWIMNDTVRNNILFGKDFNSQRYQKAIKFAALNADLLLFQDGDSTLIGEKGSTLSGGQKARISLARALYSDADIYILDDILSAVDAHVGSFLFNNTIKQYLNNKTVLLITHSLYFVKHTDRILVFDEGKIFQQGTYQQLCNSDILAQVQTAVLKKQNSIHQKKIPSVIESINERTPTSSKKINKIQQDEDEDEQGGTSIGTYESFKIYIRRNSGCYFILITVSFLAVIAFLTSYTQVWFNIWALAPQHKSAYFTYILIGINLVRGFLSLIMFMSLHASKIFQSMHDDMIRSLLFAPYSYFENVPFDKIVSRLSNDLSTNDKIFTAEFSLTLIYCQMMLSFVFNIMFVYFSKNQYLHLLYFIIHFGIMVYFYQKYFALDLIINRLQQSLIIPINSKFSQILNGLSTIRAYKKIIQSLKQFTKKINLYEKTSLLRCRIDQKIRSVVILAANLYAIIILILIYFMVDNFGTLTVFLIFNAFGFEDSIIRFHKTLYEVVGRLKSLGRCEQLTRIQSQNGYVQYLQSNYVEDQKFKKVYFGRQIFSKGQIKFESFSLRYKPQLEDVLKNITLTVKPGEKIGIVGRTGSGKSTTMLGLLRIIEASSGRIMIDGIDISVLSLQELRSNINIILQDHFLFTGTVKDNVDPTHSHTDQQVILALKHCGIWAQFEQREGVNTAITEGGDNLSSGEKQLINIARSLLNPKRIVLIDQATASIDLQTDSMIQKVMKRQFADKTVLTIAHRINTVIDSDRILVLDKGKIAEFDSPTNLLKNQSSIFAKLYKQSGKIQQKVS